jgi:TPR repeat protein
MKMMENGWVGKSTLAGAKPANVDGADMFVAKCLAAAADGDRKAFYELGVAYSTGSHGIACDMIEAHKWFNLAAVGGHEEAQFCRAEISEEMTAREIAEAQRRARQWLSDTNRKAA